MTVVNSSSSCLFLSAVCATAKSLCYGFIASGAKLSVQACLNMMCIYDEKLVAPYAAVLWCNG